jgi:5-methylcytosine-specific restriction endonuclease McrA
MRYATSESFREGRKANRDRRRRLVERIPVKARHLLMELFDGQCAYCTKPATTFDHFDPVTHGGITEPGNMLPACGPCNSRKRNKDPWQFIAELTDIPIFTKEYLVMAGRF